MTGTPLDGHRAWLDGVEVPLASLPTGVQNSEDITAVGAVTIYDAGWTFTDARGHFHAIADTDPLRVPTMIRRRRRCDGACGDPGHQVDYYVCAACEEEITLGTRTVDPPVVRSIKREDYWEFTTIEPVENPQQIEQDDSQWLHCHIQADNAGDGVTAHVFGLGRVRVTGVQMRDGGLTVTRHARIDNYGMLVLGQVCDSRARR